MAPDEAARETLSVQRGSERCNALPVIERKHWDAGGRNGIPGTSPASKTCAKQARQWMDGFAAFGSPVVACAVARMEIERMRMNYRGAALAAFAVVVMVAPTARAQVATTLEQAELAGLSPERRVEVQARAVNGNTVSEVLQTMLLNSIKLKHPASKIVALDFGRGTAVVQLTDGKMTVVPFDTAKLVVKGLIGNDPTPGHPSTMVGAASGKTGTALMCDLLVIELWEASSHAPAKT